jgi:hypothetical protein
MASLDNDDGSVLMADRARTMAAIVAERPAAPGAFRAVAAPFGAGLARRYLPMQKRVNRGGAL